MHQYLIPFLRLDTVLYVSICIMHYVIHPRMGLWVVSTFGYCGYCSVAMNIHII